MMTRPYKNIYNLKTFTEQQKQDLLEDLNKNRNPNLEDYSKIPLGSEVLLKYKNRNVNISITGAVIGFCGLFKRRKMIIRTPKEMIKIPLYNNVYSITVQKNPAKRVKRAKQYYLHKKH